MPGLTRKQLEVLEFIRRFMTNDGLPPTRGEIAEGLGLKNRQGIDQHLRALASKTGESITLNVPTSTVEPPSEQLPGGFGLPSLKACNQIGSDFECRGIYHDAPQVEELLARLASALR